VQNKNFEAVTAAGDWAKFSRELVQIGPSVLRLTISVHIGSKQDTEKNSVLRHAVWQQLV
jgi:hypothetical protein